jgi:periplasmic divalent cation tolerance protein
MPQIALVITTVPDCETGATLIRSLVERRVIACGQIVPSGRSIYRWHGEIKDEIECTLILKTSLQLKDYIADEIVKAHPYEVPEVTILTADSSHEYAFWVEQEVNSL